MGRRRQYVKTCKCYHSLPTIEETEELPSRRLNRMQFFWSDDTHVPEVEFEDCTTWGFHNLKAKLAKLQELRHNLQPPAKQLVEKVKGTYEDVMVFVSAKTEQVRAVQLEWESHFMKAATDSD